MNIADILAPKPPPTIDAARVTTHQLPDDGGETEENDMSKHSDVQKAVADCGGRATREDIATATGLDGRDLQNAIYNASKKYGLIRRDGQDFVLAKPGSSGTSEAAPVKRATAKPAKAKPAKAKPATKAKKTAAPKAEKKPRANVPPSPLTKAFSAAFSPPEAYLLRDGDLLIVDGSDRIHLTEAQYIAVLNTKE